MRDKGKELTQRVKNRLIDIQKKNDLCRAHFYLQKSHEKIKKFQKQLKLNIFKKKIPRYI